MTLSDALAAHERALHGDFVALEALRGPETGSRDGEGVHLALGALYRLVAPARAPRPALERVEAALAQPAEAAWATIALSHLTIERLLVFDGAGAGELAGVAERAPLETPSLALVRGWAALMGGDHATAARWAEAAAEGARRDASASATVEAATLRALCHLEADEIAEGTKHARRASRMARTERLLIQEYLANLALCRARRRAGRAHLAARIASALDQVAPAPWRSWLRWELALAGQRVASAGDDTPGAWLGGALDAAERGDREAFEHRAARCRASASGFASMGAEADALLTLTNPLSDLATHPTARSFGLGDTDETPYGVRDRNVGATTAALVLARPDAPSRRVLRTGVPLLGDAAWTPPEGHQKDARTHSLVSVLGLAGPEGMDEKKAFRAVYGFDLVPVKHDGVFRTLRHRAKSLVGDGATLVREGGRLALAPHVPILCPDPRTQLPTAERILALLAAGHGRVTAKQIAEELSIAVRSVQGALGELVDEGACVAERVGRRVEYGVEDTTFYEPSLHRLAARPPGT